MKKTVLTRITTGVRNFDAAPHQGLPARHDRPERRPLGFFATDTADGESKPSRAGVDETLVDGVILLSATEAGRERQCYLEVYTLRNPDHLRGRGGIRIAPQHDNAVGTQKKTGTARARTKKARRS